MFIRVYLRLVILSTLTAAHGAQLSLPSTAAAPGTSLLLPISFASQSASVAGLQFDLQYDNSTLSSNPTGDDAGCTSWTTISLCGLALSQVRFLFVVPNEEPVIAGTLVNLFVRLSP